MSALNLDSWLSLKLFLLLQSPSAGAMRVGLRSRRQSVGNRQQFFDRAAVHRLSPIFSDFTFKWLGLRNLPAVERPQVGWTLALASQEEKPRQAEGESALCKVVRI